MTHQIEQPTLEQDVPSNPDVSSTCAQPIRIRPEADIYRTKHAVRLVMDVPGARDQDMDVEVHDGLLSIEARVTRNEHEQRIYQRSFRLDRKMNTQAIDAQLERGVLTLNIPFHEEAQPKKIVIQTK